MKCHVRVSGLAKAEPVDSPLYGDQDGMIVEGPVEGRDPTFEDGWKPAKLTPNGTGIMAVEGDEEGEDREDWLEHCKRAQQMGNPHQFWIF